jgi:hypothetical protein
MVIFFQKSRSRCLETIVLQLGLGRTRITGAPNWKKHQSELTTYRILGTSKKAFSKGIENCGKGIIGENISS